MKTSSNPCIRKCVQYVESCRERLIAAGNDKSEVDEFIDRLKADLLATPPVVEVKHGNTFHDGCRISQESLQFIAKKAGGSMRDAEQLLDYVLSATTGLVVA